MNMLNVDSLIKSYKIGKTDYEVLKGISFHVNKGEFVSIMGPSGSGKSTLLNCISCYIGYESGKITLGGKELSSLSEKSLSKVRNKDMGFVFQDYMLLDGLTVSDNIILPRVISEDPAMMVGTKDKLKSLCETFGISHIISKYPAEISGGEKQRTAVARALMNDPLILLADEPTGNLDSKSSKSVIDSFLLAKEKLNTTIFMVTHDSFAASFSDRVILLKDGTVFSEIKNPGERTAFQDSLLEGIRSMNK